MSEQPQLGHDREAWIQPPSVPVTTVINLGLDRLHGFGPASIEFWRDGDRIIELPPMWFGEHHHRHAKFPLGVDAWLDSLDEVWPRYSGSRHQFSGSGFGYPYLGFYLIPNHNGQKQTPKFELGMRLANGMFLRGRPYGAVVFTPDQHHPLLAYRALWKPENDQGPKDDWQLFHGMVPTNMRNHYVVAPESQLYARTPLSMRHAIKQLNRLGLRAAEGTRDPERKAWPVDELLGNRVAEAMGYVARPDSWMKTTTAVAHINDKLFKLWRNDYTTEKDADELKGLFDFYPHEYDNRIKFLINWALGVIEEEQGRVQQS